MIPIFRAKKLDSDEYIIGDLFDGKYIIAKSELNRDISEALKHIREDILTKDCISAECKNEHHLLNKMLNKLLVNERFEHIYEIDPTTISIHFPTILDSQESKIFASLQEDGKGGDIILEESRLMCNLKIDESAFREFTAIHTMNGNRFTNEKILSDVGSYRDKYFKGYDIMIYDFFMMKKRNIKIVGIQQ